MYKKAETGLRRRGARKSTEGEVVDEETEEGMRRKKMKRRGSMEGEDVKRRGETVWL